MDRRSFISMVGGSIFAAPLGTQAQRLEHALIGYLSVRSPEESAHLLAAFRTCHSGSVVAILSHEGVMTFDPEYRGTVVDAACEYSPSSGGAYKDTYIVQRTGKQRRSILNSYFTCC